MDLASDLINLILVNLHTIILFISSNQIFNYIHKFLILWGPVPLGFKVQMSSFEIQTHKLGVLHIPPLKVNTILGVVIQLLEFIFQTKMDISPSFQLLFPR